MSDRNYFDLLDSSVHNPNGLEAILGKFRVPGTASTSTSPRAGSPPRGAYDDYGRGNWGFPLGADAWVSKLLGRKLTLCGTRDDVKAALETIDVYGPLAWLSLLRAENTLNEPSDVRVDADIMQRTWLNA